LIGDAAHAALPSAGQGASLAFADAVVLARCLRDVPEVTRAFATFGSLRRERVEKVVEQARRTSGQKGPTNAVSRAVRDQVLPFFLKLAAGQARKAAAFRVDWDERVVPAGEPPPAASLRPGSGGRGSRPRRPARRPSP
jgi:2-polyprenyl-6-methoxyphenol hydroxylase-like FAD-dependent oxidoreductase